VSLSYLGMAQRAFWPQAAASWRVAGQKRGVAEMYGHGPTSFLSAGGRLLAGGSEETRSRHLVWRYPTSFLAAAVLLLSRMQDKNEESLRC
jgi:hypothetical protein